jgi:hypothetical protein
MRKMSKHELWWVAGFLEGEGCFSRRESHPGYSYPNIDVQTSDRDVLDRLVEITGTGRVSGPFATRAAHHRPMYGWKKVGKEARELMVLLAPLMGERRREKIEEILAA